MTKGFGHDAEEPQKFIGDLGMMPESRRMTRGSKHDAKELSND